MDTNDLQKSHAQDDAYLPQLAEETLRRCHVISGLSEVVGETTRTFLSRPMRECHKLLASWMADLSMQVTVDAVGNIRGLLGSGERPRLLVGSHLDTVPCAGAYDGVLGVCLALAILEALQGTTLPFDVEVLGFSEEEGIRFRSPFLGSLALVGRLDSTHLGLQDAAGCTVEEAIREYGLDPAEIPRAQLFDRSFAYIEFHIEQGPVLDLAGEALSVVSAIAGQSRLECTFDGRANHAGTTPMNLRHDALAGTAEWVLSVEKLAQSIDGLAATVGKLEVNPGAANIIPGQVRASLDVRHEDDAIRMAAVQSMCGEAKSIASRRGLSFQSQNRVNQLTVSMDDRLVRMAEEAMRKLGETPRRMLSGAGHDAMIMAEKVPSIMLFIRSVGGISHHFDEAVYLADVQKAIRVGIQLITDLAQEASASLYPAPSI